MNILIDFTPIPVQKVGVGIYGLNLITKLKDLDRKNNYFILVQDDDTSLDHLNRERFKVIKVKSKILRIDFLMALSEQLFIPYLALKYRIDIIHSLHFSFPLLANAKKVVTIHDLTFFKIPNCHRFYNVFYFKFFIFLASIFADKIITDSKSTENDFLKIFKPRRKKTRVVYLGKNCSLDVSVEKEKIEIVKKKYFIDGDYLLFIGTIEPRKNIKNLILAFQKLLEENKDNKLVIAGKTGWYFNEVLELPQELGLKERIIFTGFIDEEDKPYLLAGAKIFIYPSIYEGFGIPVLEALACGVPTITSNVSSMPEIAGDAALLIDPLNVGELYLAMKRLLNDRALYSRLKQKSVEQAKKFSWENTALGTLAVYNSLP